MTLPALTDLDAFMVRLGVTELTDVDEARAQAALEDASALARAEANVDWMTDDDELDTENIPDVVVTIVLRAARRSFINPDEVQSESIDNYQVRYRDVYLTARECELIQQAGGATPAGLGVIATTRGPIETAPLVCNSVGSLPSVEEEDPYSLWP